MKKKLSVLFSSLAAVLVLAACGATSEVESDASSAVSSESAVDTAVTTIQVGTAGMPAPYSYVEAETEELTGYDIEILKKVFEGTQYEAEFNIVEFPAVMNGLDTGRFVIGANSFTPTAEREEKYLFSKPLYTNPLALVVPADSDVDSLEAAAGLTAIGEPAVSNTVYLETYNTENPDKVINLKYSEKDVVSQYREIANGQVDLMLHNSIIANYVIKDQGLEEELKVVPLTSDQAEALSAQSHFLFPKNEEGAAMKAFVDGRLAELRAEGTLSQLSEEFFYGDFVTSQAEFDAFN